MQSQAKTSEALSVFWVSFTLLRGLDTIVQSTVCMVREVLLRGPSQGGDQDDEML